MGSGKLLKRAIAKYGVANFTKEILHIFNTEEEMNEKERELVVVSEATYNLCDGGQGGFSYINSSPEILARRDNRKGYLANINVMTDQRKNVKGGINSKLKGAGIHNPKNHYDWSGKKHRPETITKMQKSKNVGEKNSQFGTIWIHNRHESKKIRKEEFDYWYSLGYTRGRRKKPMGDHVTYNQQTHS